MRWRGSNPGSTPAVACRIFLDHLCNPCRKYAVVIGYAAGNVWDLCVLQIEILEHIVCVFHL